MTDEEKIAETPAPKKIAKKAPKKKAAPKKSPAKKNVTKTFKAVRNYPQITIEKCLVIAQKIKELNGLERSRYKHCQAASQE